MSRGSDDGNLTNVFRANEMSLRGYLRRFTEHSHEIDDIVQEAVVRFLQAADGRTLTEPGSYLFGIARNIVRKRFERKSRSIVDFISDFSPDEYADESRPLDEIMNEQERLVRYGAAIARLPSKCRRVFVLRMIYGYSHKEISEMLNISVKTVENHVATGLTRCRDVIARLEGKDSQNETVINFPERK